MEGNVSRDAKQINYGAQNTDPNCRQEQPRQMLPVDFKERIRSRSIGKERHQHDSQRIQGPGSSEVPQQKLMQGWQRAATRTIPARQTPKRAGWKKAGCGR